MDIHEKIADLQTRTGLNRPVDELRALLQTHIPHTLTLPAIQVAGTNGKGSTVTWLLLLAERQRIGTFTSPHLRTHFERMQLNGHPIPAVDWERIYDAWKPLFDREQFTMFEADLWMALVWFAEQKADLILMEVGMGGARDATTALDYLATGITNIGWDHMQYLGDTLEDIARAKAGIFKPGVPAATSEIRLFDFLKDLAAKAGTTLTYASAVELPDSFPRWQQENLGLASCLLDLADIPQKPLTQAVENFRWPGRFQVLSEVPLKVLDGAHNLPGIEALTASMPPVQTIYFSVLADKEAPAMIRCLQATGKSLVLVHFDTPRLADLQKLADQFQLPVITLPEALADPGSALYCGSLKFAGAILEHWEPAKRISQLQKSFEDGSRPAVQLLPGTLPFLVSAPHAVNHWRQEALKPADLYTGAIALWLQEQTGCSVLLTGTFSRQDGNFDPADQSPYKQQLANFLQTHPQHLVLDLHGAGRQQPFDLEIGTGPDWPGKEDLISTVRQAFLNQGIPKDRIWTDVRFRASRNSTVTRFVIETLHTPAIQLELNRRLRDPEDPDLLEKTLAALAQIVRQYA